MEPEKGAQADARGDASVERLRDRTDELELIISSLTIFALFSIPSWLFDRFAENYTHLSDAIIIAGSVSTVVITGVCYVLGACFVLHLMARAYWVGLIGLRSAFPGGIDWTRARTLGPLSREHYRAALPTQAALIERTDRVASSLFAVISMLTLYTLWLGGLMLLTVVVSGMLGARFGATNAAISVAFTGLLVLFVGVPSLVYVLDAQLASRVRGLRDSPAYAALIAALRRVSSIAYPERLILPVQLTLQSNTRPRLFFAVLALAAIGIVTVGGQRVAAWQGFTISGEFSYLGDEDVAGGLRSTHYEDMGSGLDRMRAWPRITSFTQKGSLLSLFLPYQPLRDNLVLRENCGEPGPDVDNVACLRRLWSVSLAGRKAPMEAFLPAERADLSMRGLVGVLPLDELQPGMHEIEIFWNPESGGDALLDDRYQTVSRSFTIPFMFAPDFERSLAQD